jgi:hypothetical protein
MIGALILFVIAALLCLRDGNDGAVLAVWSSGLGLGLACSLTAVWRNGERGLRREGAPLALVISVAAGVCLARLADFPPTVHADVGEIALGAAAMDVPRDIFRFTSSWWGVPGLHHAIQRAGLFVNHGLVGARLPDAVVGVLAAAAFYLAMCEVGDRRSALVTALCAVGSVTLITTWRSGLGLAPPILIIVVAYSAFLRASRGGEGARDLYAVAGIFAGLAVQVNWSARVVPIVLVTVSALELAMRPRIALRRVLPGLVWTTLYALAVASPLLIHAGQRPDLFVSHSEKTIFSESGWRHTQEIRGTASFASAVLAQAWRSFGMFHYYPNGNLAGFYPKDRPFFEPLPAALFLLGAAAACIRPTESRRGWTVAALVTCLLLDVVTLDGPSYHRAGPAAAMALLLACIGCQSLLALVESAAAGVRGKRIADSLAVILGATGFLWGTISYFSVQSRIDWPLSNSTAVARRIAAEPADRSFAYLLTAPEFYFGYGNIRFLAAGHRGADLPPGATAPLLFPGVNLFIALPSRVPELLSLARSLPKGTWEEHYKVASPGVLEMLVLRIEVPPSFAATVKAPEP